MTDQPKPWNNKISIDISTEQLGGEQPDHAMILRQILVASCTCGDYKEAFPGDTDLVGILARAQPHMDSHPMEPQSMCQLGNGDVAMVFAVPGLGEEKTVHMTITVTEEVWNDSVQLAKHIGLIGSPTHFQAEEDRRALEARHQRGHEHYFHAIPVEPHQIQGILDQLRAQAGDAGVAFFQRDEPAEEEQP